MKEERIINLVTSSFLVLFVLKTLNDLSISSFILLELKINGHMEKINVVVIDLNSMNMFLEYNWLFKYNPKLNWDKKTI